MKLTNSEMEVMQVLWQSEKPLSTSEIIKNSPDVHYKKSYIHLLINSLLNKDVIEVTGFVKTARNYARTFKAKISEKDYLMSQFIDRIPLDDCIRLIISHTDDVNKLDEFTNIINDYRTKIAHKI